MTCDRREGLNETVVECLTSASESCSDAANTMPYNTCTTVCCIVYTAHAHNTAASNGNLVILQHFADYQNGIFCPMLAMYNEIFPPVSLKK